MSAVISECGRYRYRLARAWEPSLDGKAGSVAWVMLNPSTADAELDDHTLTKCIAFTRRWGYSELAIVNLFALRSRDPSALRVATDPVGPENNAHLLDVCARSALIVVAWGSSWPGPLADYVHRLGDELRDVGRRAGVDVRCLGRTGQGDPRHPVYLAYTTELVPW